MPSPVSRHVDGTLPNRDIASVDDASTEAARRMPVVLCYTLPTITRASYPFRMIDWRHYASDTRFDGRGSPRTARTR